jgi:hypothetical protein|tara:strand:- start:426 stop:689 length:264 start_codon:yes stop_codon:yes gene_type:complete
MTEEINKSDINKMNKIIFKKINEQFDKDLTPSEFIATSRLALAFQKTIQVNEVGERDEKEIYENIMSVLDRAAMRIKENESDDNDNL